MKYIKKFLTVAIIVTLGMGATAFSDNLQKSFVQGQITEGEYVIQKLRRHFKPNSVNERFKLKSGTKLKPTRDVTMLLNKAQKHMEEYTQQDLKFLKALFKRPTNVNYILGTYLPAPVKTFEPDISNYPNIGGKFKFWYVDHNIADNKGVTHTTTLTKVKEMAGYFDFVYKRELKEMGYKTPLSDTGSADEGGDSKFDIYLVNIGIDGTYGFVASEKSPDGGNGTYAYMVMDNDFSYKEFYTEPSNSMSVTAAHEYHHAVQMAYNINADAWFYEATSTWMEEKVYDSVNDNRQYIPAVFKFPQNSLDLFANDGHQYGAWIFNEYLSTRFGNDIIRKIWDKLDPNNSDNSAINAIESILQEKSESLKDILLGFWAKNYQKDSFYEEGKEWGNITIENSTISTEEQSVLLYHLGTRLFRFTPNGSSTATASLKIEIEAKKDIGAIAVAKFSDGTYKEYPFKNVTSIYIPNFTTSKMQEVILIIANYGKTLNDDEKVVKYRGLLTEINGNIYDLNDDGVVDDSDINEVVKIWSLKKGDTKYKNSYDFDNSGEISVIDIMTIVNQAQ